MTIEPVPALESKGSRGPRRALSDEEVYEIRRPYAAGRALPDMGDLERLAGEYGVSWRTIYRALYGLGAYKGV